MVVEHVVVVVVIDGSCCTVVVVVPVVGVDTGRIRIRSLRTFQNGTEVAARHSPDKAHRVAARLVHELG